MVRMPSALKADRLSHAFCGTVSVTVYPASDVFAFANGCADAGPAVTQNAMNVIAYARMNISTFLTKQSGLPREEAEFAETISRRAHRALESLVRRWVAGLRPAHGSSDTRFHKCHRNYGGPCEPRVARSMPRVARPTASLTSACPSRGPLPLLSVDSA